MARLSASYKIWSSRFSDVINTLNGDIKHGQSHHSDPISHRTATRVAGRSGTFTLLLNDIVTACKKISHLVNRGDLIGVLGSAESENVQGEVQKKLDIITNDIMVNALNWTGHLAGMASEEVDDIIKIPSQYPKGKYLALFDPLDGSSNIDVNLTVGTIFSILRCREGVDPTLEDFLRKAPNRYAPVSCSTARRR